MAILFAGLMLASAPAVQGAGFLIYEHGAAAMAIAGAFTGLANDPSAIWHNPAGLAWVEGTQLLLGGTLIVPSGSLTMDNLPGAPVYKQVKQRFFPPNFYLTSKLSDRLAIGVGVFAPFGLGTEWPNEANDFPLRYLAVMSEMQTIQINGAIAYKLSDNFSVGGGVYYVDSKLKEDIVQAVQISPALPVWDVPTTLDVKGTAFGWNAGLLFKSERFSFGVNYRSRFDVDYEGTVVSSTAYVPEAYQAYIPTEGDGVVTFKFPDILTFGLAVRLTDNLTWSADIHDYLWKRYDSYVVEVDYPDPYPDMELAAAPAWKNNLCYRTGLQFEASDSLTLRGGFAYDVAPQPIEDMSPSLPDANRIIFTAGFGYRIGKLVLDFAYQYEQFAKRTSDHHYIFGPGTPNLAAGTYKTSSHLFGLNLGYRF